MSKWGRRGFVDFGALYQQQRVVLVDGVPTLDEVVSAVRDLRDGGELRRSFMTDAAAVAAREAARLGLAPMTPDSPRGARGASVIDADATPKDTRALPPRKP